MTKGKSKLKNWLRVGACVLLAFTVAGAISNIFAHRPVEPTEDENMLHAPAFYVPIKPGEGLYANRAETLDFNYDGDYTAMDYNLGFKKDSSYIVGGTSANDTWIRTKYENSNIYLEIGKNVLGNPLVEFDRAGEYSSDKLVVFEADIKWDRPESSEMASGKSQPWFYKFEFNDGKYYGDERSHLALYFYLAGDGFSITDKVSDVPAKVDPDELPDVYLNTWVNLRVEFTESTYTVFLNGRRLCSGITTVFYLTEYGASMYPPTRFSIETRHFAQQTVIGLDNVFFGIVEKN